MLTRVKALRFQGQIETDSPFLLKRHVDFSVLVKKKSFFFYNSEGNWLSAEMTLDSVPNCIGRLPCDESDFKLGPRSNILRLLSGFKKEN